MEYYPFPALLLSDYNSIHEYGRATPGPPNCLDFSSDFVPLLPLGAEAAIRWMVGDQSQSSFSGSVYLSSPQLLRLVDVDEEQLRPARDLFAVNTRIPAVFSRQEGLRLPARAPLFPAEILYLGTERIKLRTGAPVEENAQISLSAQVEFLTLQQLPLRVARRVVLRKQETLLLCDVLPMSDENFIALSTHAARLQAAAEAEDS